MGDPDIYIYIQIHSTYTEMFITCSAKNLIFAELLIKKLVDFFKERQASILKQTIFASFKLKKKLENLL